MIINTAQAQFIIVAKSSHPATGFRQWYECEVRNLIGNIVYPVPGYGDDPVTALQDSLSKIKIRNDRELAKSVGQSE